MCVKDEVKHHGIVYSLLTLYLGSTNQGTMCTEKPFAFAATKFCPFSRILVNYFAEHCY